MSEQTKIKGISPLLFNRFFDDEFKKERGESDYEFQERIWKEKAHTNSEGHLIIPSVNWTKALTDSSKKSGIKAIGATKKNDNLSLLFKCTLFIEDFIVENIDGSIATKNDLKKFNSSVCVGGQKSKRILNCRPMIEQWQGTLIYEIIDPSGKLRKNIIDESLIFCGLFNGIGEWRPQNGGKFGRFTI